MQTTHKHSDFPTLATLRRSLRVLIVEDELRLRELLLEVMPDMGFGASAARSAEDALRLMESESVDIVILDLQLPLMGGMELFQIIRDRWPFTAVVILTGFGDLTVAREAIRLDVVDFLSKPFHLRDIEVALARASKRVIAGQPAESSWDIMTTESPITLEENERQLILAALERHNGNRTAAAAELGISRRKLHYWLSQHLDFDR